MPAFSDMANQTLAQLADQLDASPDYLVLRRFELPRSYASPTGKAQIRTAAALDVETTGLDRQKDAIIQLSMVPFTYDAESGQIFDVGDAFDSFEDPRRPIPPDVVKLTGITDADVAGKRIDDAALRAFLEPVSLVIAHNAEFDRQFAERRSLVFQDKAWACTMRDIHWERYGLHAKSLEYLLIKRCRRFYGAHRADQDASALVHLLASPLEDGTLPMSLLLESARRNTVRIWALGAPIEIKDVLKARKYKWNSGGDGRPKAWYCEVPADEQAAEMEWLSTNVYNGTKPKLRTDALDARVRYSERS